MELVVKVSNKDNIIWTTSSFRKSGVQTRNGKKAITVDTMTPLVMNGDGYA